MDKYSVSVVLYGCSFCFAVFSLNAFVVMIQITWFYYGWHALYGGLVFVRLCTNAVYY